MSKRLRTEPAIDPPSKRAGKQSKRSSGPSSTPTTSLLASASASPTATAGPLTTTSMATAVTPSATDLAAASTPSAAAPPLNLTSAVLDSTTGTTETPPLAESVDRKGDHLLDAFKRSMEGMEVNLNTILRELQVIHEEIQAILQSNGGFEDGQKSLQESHNRFKRKVDMAKALEAEMKMWTTKKLGG